MSPLVAISIWIVIEAIARFRNPVEPKGGWVLVVGLAGLALNLGAAAVLRRRGSESLNVQGALRHVLADALGSVGVVVAGAVVLTTGWSYADPLVALGIAALVLASSWSILRDSVGILLESTPRGMDAEEIGRAMVEVDGVREVHDLHVWTITSGFHVAVGPRPRVARRGLPREAARARARARGALRPDAHDAAGRPRRKRRDDPARDG